MEEKRAGSRVRRLAVAVAVAALGLTVAACGGGGSSSEEVAATSSPETQEAVKPPRTKRHLSATQMRRKEKAGSGERKELVEEEEELKAEEKERFIAEEEAAPPSKKHRHEPKPAPEPEEESTASAADPIAVEEFEGFSTEPDHSNWEIAYSVCAVTPEKQMSKEFHTEQNWAAIGHAYGDGYSEPFNIAPEEGCMAAIKDSETQREAMFAVMEEGE
jgi:hypothetical protein